MIRTVWMIAAASVLSAACAHSKTVGEREPSERGTPVAAEPIQAKPGRPIVSAQPKELFEPKTVTRIQRRLGVKETGKMDVTTQKALAKFQDEHKLPATGFPDTHTLEELGIKADAAQKQAGTEKTRARTDEAEGERAKDVDSSKKE